MREREGRASFQAEKQNEPLDPDLCRFAEARLHSRDPQYDNERALITGVGDGYFLDACDPSVGRRKNKGDYSSIIILYRSEETEISTVIARRSSDQTIERVVPCAGKYPFEEFVVETNNFQDLLVGNLSRSSPVMA
ncbi:MAG: hypothetical protein IID41_01830 [Planctomycetes bacterium]|nr:hypothetical protein [Planctomycetota bacterium]